jgi:hypothetical protein
MLIGQIFSIRKIIERVIHIPIKMGVASNADYSLRIASSEKILLLKMHFLPTPLHLYPYAASLK